MYLKLGTLGFAVASFPTAARAFLYTVDLPLADCPLNAAARRISYVSQDPSLPTMALDGSSSTGSPPPISSALVPWPSGPAPARRSETGRMVRSALDLSQRGEPVRVQEVAMVALGKIPAPMILSRRVFDSNGVESSKFKSMVLALMRAGGLANIQGTSCRASHGWTCWAGVERCVKSLHERFHALRARMLRECADTAASRKSSEGEVVVFDTNRRDSFWFVHNSLVFNLLSTCRFGAFGNPERIDRIT